MVINQSLITRDRKYGGEPNIRDVCPHISVCIEESNYTYFISVTAIIYCKLCKKEYDIENGTPE